MRIYRSELKISTPGHGYTVNLTPQVQAECLRSGVRRGTMHLFVVGSTAALGTIEFEPGLCQDLPLLIDRLVPPQATYHHDATWHDGNGHSHLQATLLGASLTVPVEDAKPVLGTWQQIFLIECDIRPRHRQVILTVMGE